jgi:CRP/FNR family transcriptional regulator, cyclic AMP receptor protein
LDSPELVDHLVTFIACQILTGDGLTEILGTRTVGFLAAKCRLAGPEPPMLPCGILAGSVCAGLFPD